MGELLIDRLLRYGIADLVVLIVPDVVDWLLLLVVGTFLGHHNPSGRGDAFEPYRSHSSASSLSIDLIYGISNTDISEFFYRY